MKLSIFEGKSVLITGHTGFKGAWLTTWLSELGANITGLSLDPHTTPSMFDSLRISSRIDDKRIDIRNAKAVRDLVAEIQPDFVFHLAAQALVSKSYESPRITWETNVMGTLNLLDALEDLEKKCSVVIVTSDKCYENVEWLWGYKESDLLGGSDPYSASKASVELLVNSYIRSFFQKPKSNVVIATARAGNVIGGGDWSPNRLVPDCMLATSKGEATVVRNPNSTRPWQHVLEPLSGYLALAIALTKNENLQGEAFNFGPSNSSEKSVLQLVTEMKKKWKAIEIEISENKLDIKEARLLKLNCEKSDSILLWRSCLTFEETTTMTVDWYSRFYGELASMEEITHEQINLYTTKAIAKKIDWAV